MRQEVHQFCYLLASSVSCSKRVQYLWACSIVIISELEFISVLPSLEKEFLLPGFHHLPLLDSSLVVREHTLK